MAGFVFVSYSRRDADYVARLADRVERAGVEVWRDTTGITYGDRWEKIIQERVDACAAVIVVMSEAAEASPHVGNELQRARDLGKPILPVLLSGRSFFALGTVHRFDAHAGQLPDSTFLRHLADLVATPTGAELPRTATRPAVQVVVGDPPGQAVAWQDRPALLQELVDRVDSGATAVVCALAGQRGVGKTQLAAAYARLRIQHGWPVVVWAVAETRAGIVAALDELATVVGVRESDEDPEQAARSGLRWLRSQPGPCLLVYDNAVDADLIRDWTPTLGEVHTVVTTTHQDLDTLGDLLDVAMFTDAEAVAYLGRRTKLVDPDGAAVVAEHLGRLPLALAQAGAIIGIRRRYPSYRKYVDALQRALTATLLPRPAGDPYPHGLAEAVLLSLDDLAVADPVGHARRLLDRLAVLAPTGADTTLLDHLANPDPPVADADDAGPVEVDTLVAVLAGRSLTVPAVDADRVIVHRLVQRVVRELCQHAGTLDDTVTAAADALMAAADQVGDRWDTRALIGEYAAHMTTLTACPISDATRERLLAPRMWMLHWLQAVHSYPAAATFGVALLADAERALGPDHPDTIGSRAELARAYQQVGRVDEAIELGVRTVADSERVLGPDHPDTLTSRNSLAIAYLAAGWLDEAIELFTYTLADSERLLGPDHPDTLTSRNNLAAIFHEVGRAEGAIELHTRTLAGCERVLGPDHPDTLTSRQNLADVFHAVGRVSEAIELHTRTLSDRERVLGPDHHYTLTSRGNLAVSLQAAGRVDEAIELSTRALTDCERVLGPDHPDTLSVRNNLALAYKADGRVDEAIELFTRALTDCERVLGPDHRGTLGARNNLAMAYQADGRVDEAIELFIYTVAGCERVLGPDHPDTISTRDNLATAYEEVGRLDEAAALRE